MPHPASFNIRLKLLVKLFSWCFKDKMILFLVLTSHDYLSRGFSLNQNPQLLVFSLWLWIISTYALQGATTSKISTSFNVMDYAAVGDAKTDDSRAFLRAWNAVCKAQSSASGPTPTLLIPANTTFMLQSVSFTGPCNSSQIYFQVSGNLVAPNKKTEWNRFRFHSWLSFSNINGLTVKGRGQIDGQGSAWWSNPCLHAGATCKGPSALLFYRCNNLRLEDLTHINSPRGHIILTHCNGAIISNLHIIAPEKSPNTDGIDISGSRNVQILNSNIGTGDDCIAISGGSSNINIKGITCGPGHGISIGALGHGGVDIVEDVHVQNCTLKGTLNGVRIKSWQGGSGYARNISFNNIRFEAVNNAIIIDQFYCPHRVNCPKYASAVRVSDVSFKGITGTSKMEEVINLNCSQSIGCSNIVFDQVYITTTNPGRKAFASCFNAHGRFSNVIPAVKCLLP